MAKMFSLNWRDVVVGLLLAVAGSVLVTIQGALQSGAVIDWALVLKVAEATFVSYLVKNFFSDESGKIGGKI